MTILLELSYLLTLGELELARLEVFDGPCTFAIEVVGSSSAL